MPSCPDPAPSAGANAERLQDAPGGGRGRRGASQDLPLQPSADGPHVWVGVDGLAQPVLDQRPQPAQVLPPPPLCQVNPTLAPEVQEVVMRALASQPDARYPTAGAFAAALRQRALESGQSTVAAYVVALTAVSCAGVGFFSFPHPLHNVFGMSELIGYQAPLVLAITWRHDRGSGEVVRMSWIMAAVVWIAIIINLPILDRQGSAYALIRPTYGLVQRALFASWFTWCTLLGILLFRDRGAKQVLR